MLMALSRVVSVVDLCAVSLVISKILRYFYSIVSMLSKTLLCSIHLKETWILCVCEVFITLMEKVYDKH